MHWGWEKARGALKLRVRALCCRGTVHQMVPPCSSLAAYSLQFPKPYWFFSSINHEFPFLAINHFAYFFGSIFNPSHSSTLSRINLPILEEMHAFLCQFRSLFIYPSFLSLFGWPGTRCSRGRSSTPAPPWMANTTSWQPVVSSPLSNWVKTGQTWAVCVLFQCFAEMGNPFTFLIQMDSWPAWYKGKWILFG